jgi:muramoyltetrapeptide carboxypeptidase
MPNARNASQQRKSSGARLLRPERLSFGDTVGIAAPASAPHQPKEIDHAIHALERLGFKPKPARHLRERLGFLAGSDRDRADDLMRLFADRNVKAIFCLRGGYGSGRLLSRLDFDLVRRNPKIFLGFSDITALHCAFQTRAGLVSFHGPMLSSHLAQSELSDFTLHGLLRTLMRPKAPGSICTGFTEKAARSLRRGSASGRLLGGNLSVLCTTLGTPWQPQFKGRILFLEDIDEAPYRIDRMLTQLLNAGLLQQVAGVALGVSRGCVDPQAEKSREYRQGLEDVLKDRLLPLKVPVVAGLPFGHTPCNATLPLGVHVLLDASKADLSICEPAVL